MNNKQSNSTYNLSSDLSYWYWLCNIDGMGSLRLQQLLDCYSVPEEVYKRDPDKIRKEVPLSPRQYSSMKESKQTEAWRRAFEDTILKGIHMVRYIDPEYPKRLLSLRDKPILLYYLGNLPQEQGKIAAIVGARNCTVYGCQIAEEIGRKLGKAGIQTISGMAAGIDAAGQRGTLKGGGKSYGILGSGVDICYPRSNRRLYEDLIAGGGIISEYPPGTQPYASNFPMRNRIISGMSDMVIVVEAKERSGSLITVDFALDQGRDVYAVPGRMTDRLSCGCNRLISQGAGILTDLESLLLNLTVEGTENEAKVLNSAIELAEPEKLVYSELDFEPKNIQTLMEETRVSFTALTSILLGLQLKNLIEEPMKGYYVRKT